MANGINSNLENHVKIVGALYVAFSIVGFTLGLFILFAFLLGSIFIGEVIGFILGSTIGIIVSVTVAGMSIPSVIAGIGLLCGNKSWAKITVIILGIINLVNFPFGTILGVYTLWVLLQV